MRHLFWQVWYFGLTPDVVVEPRVRVMSVCLPAADECTRRAVFMSECDLLS